MKTIYTPIAVSSGELPDTFGDYITLPDHLPYFFDGRKWFNNYGKFTEPTHWLKKEEVPELTEEEKQEWKQQRISKILEEANGSWKDLVEDGFYLGIEYAKLASKVEVKWEENMK